MSQFEPKSALYEIVAFKKSHNLSLSLYRRKSEEIGQKWILEPLFSEI